MILPDASLPMLEPRVEVVTYHARTSARIEGVVSCDKTDLCHCQNTRNSLCFLRYSLLYTSKRPKVATSDTDHAQNCCQEQDPEIFEDREDSTA